MDFLETGGLSPGGYGFGELGIDSVSELVKALQTSYTTDAAQMVGGRALIPENLEGQVVNALNASRTDLKFMNLLYEQKVNSPIHEYTRRNSVGDYMGIFASEGASGRATNQDLQRVVRPMKYMQTYREVTLQMQVSGSLEDAVASEVEAGTFTLLQGSEYGCFHGDSSIVPSQFDGALKQIASDPASTILDLRGQNFTTSNAEAQLNEVARLMYEKGGSADVMFCPPIVSKDIQALVSSRMFIRTSDDTFTTVVKRYPTLYGSDLEIAGESAGPNKFFFVKNKPTPSTDAVNMPVPPSLSVVAATSVGPGPGFVAQVAGTYYYQAFAISEGGISQGSAPVQVAVAAGQQVNITVTPGGAVGPGPGSGGTGVILCRSNLNASNGGDCREFIRVPLNATGTTSWIDQNADLPGTATVLFLTNRKINRAIQWDSFLPPMRFELFPSSRLVVPMMIVRFGSLDCKISRQHGMIKNVGHSGLAGWVLA